TIPDKHNANPYLMLLGRKGVLVIVGALEPLGPFHGGLLMRNTRAVAGSALRGVPDTQELLDFCAEHNILPECEMISMQDINKAYERMEHNDVKYRFVIDMASLKAQTRALRGRLERLPQRLRFLAQPWLSIQLTE